MHNGLTLRCNTELFIIYNSQSKSAFGRFFCFIPNMREVLDENRAVAKAAALIYCVLTILS